MVRRNTRRKLRGGAEDPEDLFPEEGESGASGAEFPMDDESGASGATIDAYKSELPDKTFDPVYRRFPQSYNAELAKLREFESSLQSTASGATGPVYDKNILIDQMHLLDSAIEPFRKVVQEMHDLKSMIKLGTSNFLTQHHKNSENVISTRIKHRVNAFTKKHKNKKKIKLSKLQNL